MRTLLAALAMFGVVAGYAHPVFDGWRPSVIEHPMQALHGQLNEALSSARRTAMAGLDPVQLRGRISVYMTRAEAQIKRAD